MEAASPSRAPARGGGVQAGGAPYPRSTRSGYTAAPEILRAEPRLGRVQKGTGQRWEFDFDVIVGGERRPVRVVIEVPKDGGRPLLISAHVILK